MDHCILLHRLKHCGFRGKVYVLFFIKLHGRYRFQVVTNNSITYSRQNIVTGVPEGSVLGLLLFSSYINDLQQIIDCAEIFMYSDNTCIMVTADNIT